MPTHIDPCSLAVAPIVPICRDAPLSHATGFVWLTEDGAYLITNWHVVAGRRTDNAQPLSEDKGWVPDRLLARFLHWDGAETIATQYDIALYDAEGKPTWFWHPVYGRHVDVVALRLTSRAPESGYRAINQVALDRDLWTQVGMDVFILGYPLNLRPPWLPVWKRGSLASEPDLVQLADHFYTVDTASRPGMSGAPVIQRSYGTHLTYSGPSTTTEPATKFLGIYSGREATTDLNQAQLGRVFPAVYIEHIVEVRKRDHGDIWNPRP